MIRNFSLTNETDLAKHLWIEPECFDYWLLPAQTFEVQVDETSDDSTSDLDHREDGWTLFPSGGAECVTVLHDGMKLPIGYQRPVGT